MDLAKRHMGKIDLGINTWYETWKQADLTSKTKEREDLSIESMA